MSDIALEHDGPIFGAFFDHHEDRHPFPFELQWSAFCKVLEDVHVRDEKFSYNGPGYSLAQFTERHYTDKKTGVRSFGVLRQNMFVDRMSGIVIDFDAQFDIDDVLRCLQGIALAAHTTWKHMTDGVDADGNPMNYGPRWRVIIPLAVPVPGPKYKAARAWLMNRLGGNQPDKTAVALSNFYFLPCCAPGNEGNYELRIQDGPFLELPAMSEFTRGLPPPRIVGNVADWEWLKAKMRAYKDDDMRAAFKKVLRGESFAAHGGRDNMLMRMCGALAGWAPGVEPEELAEVFRASLDAMTAERPDDPPPSVEGAADKIARSQDSLLAEAREENPAAAEQVQEVEVPEGAPPDLVDEWAMQLGLENGDMLRRRLILRKGNSLWLFRPDLATWQGPLTESEAQGAARLELGAIAGVNVYQRKLDGGLRLKTLPELFHEYGEPIDYVQADLRISREHYDPHKRKLTLTGAPFRPLEATYNQFVDEWLRAMGGVHQEKLLDWIAGLTWLTRPNSVLFLKGDPNVGKGLLLRGLARVWEQADNPVDMKRIVDNFNEDLRRCPLVQISEGKWNKFADVTTMLRDLVTQPSRTFNEKHMSKFELVGYLRFVVTANNFNIFANDQYSLTPQDRDAIARRFLEIEPDPRAGEILASLEPDERDALASDNHIAAHALWLSQNRDVSAKGRFIVEGERDGRFAMRIITEDLKWGSWVMEWLARYLSDPVPVEREFGGLVHRDAGKVLVSPDAVVNTFDKVLKNKRPPQALEISNVLRSLSTGKLIPLPGNKGSGFEILVDEVVWWSQEKGVGNPGNIRFNASVPKAEQPKVTNFAHAQQRREGITGRAQ